MGKISPKRRQAVQDRLEAAVLRWGARVSASLEDERETLSIFVVRADGAHRTFKSDSRRKWVAIAEYAARRFALPY